MRRMVLAVLTAALLSAGAADEPVNAERYFEGSLMPKAEQRRLAQRILGDVWYRDAELDDYFAQIAARLSPGNEFLITVADKEDINAFAYYSGILVFYRGLWKFAESESELLGILAHEMAHIIKNHYETTQENAETASVITTPILIAGILIDDPEISEALISGSVGLLNDSILSYSRELEHEADIVALDMLLEAGFDPTGMIDIFSRFESAPHEYLSSHPSSERRGAYLSDRLLTAEYETAESSLDFRLLKEKLSLKKDLLRSYAKRQQLKVKKAKTAEDKLVAQYGLLLVATRTRNFPVAKSALAALRGQTHPYIMRAMAKNLLDRGEIDDAVALLDEALALHPQRAALVLTRLIAHERAKDFAAGVAYYESLPPALRMRDDILAQSGRLAALAKNQLASNYLLALGHSQGGFFERSLSQIEIAEQYLAGGDLATLKALRDLKKEVEIELEMIKERKFEN